MSVKKAYLRKKINGVVYDIYARTSADVVSYDSTVVPSGSVAKAISELTTALQTVTSENGTIDTKISTACTNLYNQILGLTGEEGETINQAYDTLKEIADWIDGYEGEGGAAAAITDAISTLRTTVGTASVAAHDEEPAVAATGLIARIEALEGRATNVTASQTNGAISVDGTDVTVYTHPASHAATMITTDADHNFVTTAQLGIINNAAAVNVVTSVPENASDKDLFIIVDPDPDPDPDPEQQDPNQGGGE